MDDNQVSDISPLKDLEYLFYLGLDSNPVSDMSVLDGKSGLTIYKHY